MLLYKECKCALTEKASVRRSNITMEKEYFYFLCLTSKLAFQYLLYGAQMGHLKRDFLCLTIVKGERRPQGTKSLYRSRH